MDSRNHAFYQSRLNDIVKNISQIILGKDEAIRLSLTCLLCRGHLLIEDLPGMGKTTLAHALSTSLGLKFNRIQFTSDLLPADILGISIFEQANGQFNFHPGPVFTQVLLADEINRATPKAQSALLEAMEEHQVTTEGKTRNLPEPFFVIATQNPGFQIGTFPLPESQLDRFFMRIHLGYPDAQAERELLTSQDRHELIEQLQCNIELQDLFDLQHAVKHIHVSADLLDYIQALITFSREPGHFASGLSPRAGLALLHAAQAWALMCARDHALPEDVQKVLPSIVNHRLQPVSGSHENNPLAASEALLNIPIP